MKTIPQRMVDEFFKLDEKHRHALGQPKKKRDRDAFREVRERRDDAAFAIWDFLDLGWEPIRASPGGGIRVVRPSPEGPRIGNLEAGGTLSISRRLHHSHDREINHVDFIVQIRADRN